MGETRPSCAREAVCQGKAESRPADNGCDLFLPSFLSTWLRQLSHPFTGNKHFPSSEVCREREQLVPPKGCPVS